ncbi:MAG: glycine--tRNA ligase subunit beta, partial [Desulfobacterota bacterium]|nr:glycine--tRNA ligase subunit beta [Thermodesulfobacteriota bacterium]
MMRSELLLEIGTEEIPARFLFPALAGMRDLLQSEFQTQRINFEKLITLGTPRRLLICAKGVAEKQIDTMVTTVGPPWKIAFDSEGNPTKAAENFALRQGVTVDDLEVIETHKGKYVRVAKTIEGKETLSLLPEILKKVILNIPFPKYMRWADLDLRFARPIKWILAIFNKVIIPVDFDNLKSSNQSWGHRFLSNKPFEVFDLKSYQQIAEEHFVNPDPEKRKELIKNTAQRLAEEVGGKELDDEELLTEVGNLVEYPVVLRGSFSPLFLNLPPEVIISSLREHQKYFAVVDSQGNLLPYFIVVANNIPRDPKVVIKGNERVLSARLADAQFFFQEDRKKTLFERREALKSVVYQVKLGSMYDKVMRLEELAGYLASQIAPSLIEKVKRAAFLCKSDLLTEMVGEFPKLQGVIGREYAKLEGEDPEVAEAIYEH